MPANVFLVKWLKSFTCVGLVFSITITIIFTLERATCLPSYYCAHVLAEVETGQEMTTSVRGSKTWKTCEISSGGCTRNKE